MARDLATIATEIRNNNAAYDHARLKYDRARQIMQRASDVMGRCQEAAFKLGQAYTDALYAHVQEEHPDLFADPAHAIRGEVAPVTPLDPTAQRGA